MSSGLHKRPMSAWGPARLAQEARRPPPASVYVPDLLLRLLWLAAAYGLFRALRSLPRRTEWGGAEAEQLRRGLIEIAARVKESQRRVLFELCGSCRSQAIWRVLVRRLGVVAG
jgi:Transposase DDE domain group 1